jgi:hypothetical protein
MLNTINRATIAAFSILALAACGREADEAAGGPEPGEAMTVETPAPGPTPVKTNETDPPVARVLGETLSMTDPDGLQQAILTSLFDHYAAEHDLEALEAEVDHFVEKMEQDMRDMGLDAGDDLTEEEEAEADSMRRQMGEAMIRQWKINRALYDQYGGRIIYQQLGPEPLDAYREFLEEQRSAGAFEILDPDLEAAFWRYFTDERIHDFMEPGSADAERAFSTPPWERQPAG